MRTVVDARFAELVETIGWPAAVTERAKELAEEAEQIREWAERDRRNRLAELCADLSVVERWYAHHPRTRRAVEECRRALELERRALARKAA